MDVNVSLDFLLTVVKGHLLTAACQTLGTTKLDLPLRIPRGIRRCSSANQCEFLKTIATEVVDKFTLVDKALMGEKVAETGDGVHNYARVLCHYGALVMEFLDSWKEGDGDRVLAVVSSIFSDDQSSQICTGSTSAADSSSRLYSLLIWPIM